MVRCIYNRRECTMTIHGHAMTAPIGTDLVCASSSILGFTLIACTENNMDRFRPSMSQVGDTLRVACQPSKSYVTPCRRMMDTIFTGFEVLENAFPDNVRTEKED